MLPLRHLLTCIGEAICTHGLRALAGLVPLGTVLYDVAEKACQQLRDAKQDAQLRQLIEVAAVADPADVKREAHAVAATVAANQPPDVQAKLAAYLEQVPPAVRRSLRRPTDPSGRSVPLRFALQRPEDVLELLPASFPRFQVGDSPPNLGDWELCELLGMGGFGEVWKARHRYFDGIAPVAFKFCLDPTVRERLLGHEARVLNQVMRQGRHPGIVPLLDASLSSDPPCLKYEYVAGGDLSGLLRDWRDQDAQPRWRLATQVMLQLARIVAFAHGLTPPIVHRDLKPGNVLVTSEGELRVTDFGLGGTATGPMVTSLRGSHTPLYASPQQMRGEAPDPRDDVHALGVMWYQLLLGDLTAGAPTGLWTEELTDLGAPAELVRVLGACVARPDKRPRDAGVLAEQLTALLTPPVPVAVAPVLEERLAQFLRTGRTGALSGMLDLTNKGIGDAGVIALANSPRLANLSVLILSGCHVTDVGLTALAASPHVMNLTRLDLWDNHIGDAGVKALAECKCLDHLSQLDLGRNRVGDEGICALAASPHFRNLGELMLVSNHVGDVGALALAESPYLANLAWLKPLDNRITAKGADVLKKAFGRRVRIM